MEKSSQARFFPMLPSGRKRTAADIEQDEEQQQDSWNLPLVDNAALGFSNYNGGGETPPATMEDPEPEPEYYLPILLPSRKREVKHLGKPGKRSSCFLCCYCGERNTTLPNDDVQKIVEMLRQYTGRMDSVALAKLIADHYAKFQERINSHLLRGEDPLPDMTAATVLEHIRKHTADPELKQVIMLEELQEMREELLKIVFEKHNKKNIKRVNKANLDALEKVIKMEMVVQQKDASKMAFFSAGARVNGMAQGPVATQTKTLFDCWKKART